MLVPPPQPLAEQGAGTSTGSGLSAFTGPGSGGPGSGGSGSSSGPGGSDSGPHSRGRRGTMFDSASWRSGHGGGHGSSNGGSSGRKSMAFKPSVLQVQPSDLGDS